MTLFSPLVVNQCWNLFRTNGGFVTLSILSFVHHSLCGIVTFTFHHSFYTACIVTPWTWTLRFLFVRCDLRARSYASPCIYRVSDPYTGWRIIRSHCCKHARAAHCRGHINATERGVSRARPWFFTFFFIPRQMRFDRCNPFISGGFKSD